MAGIMTFARGSWQREVVFALATGDHVKNPVSSLEGKAKYYSKRYQRSFNNLLSRIKDAGYAIEYTPGVRGGAWSAKFRLVKEAIGNA